MENIEKIITLNFNRKDFEEIYFRDNQGNLFVSKQIKNDFLFLVVAIVLFLFAILYSYINERYFWLTIISFVVLISSVVNYFAKAITIYKWKKSVNDLINYNSQFSEHKLIITTSSFTLIQDTTESISKWSAITNALIEDNYLIIYGQIEYFFPKKSMGIQDYQYLIDMIKKHI
jgi:hypothetical protein